MKLCVIYIFFSLQGDNTYSTTGNTWRIPFGQPSGTPSFPALTIDYIMVAKNPNSLKDVQTFNFEISDAKVIDLKLEQTAVGPFSDINGVSLSDHNAIEATISIMQ